MCLGPEGRRVMRNRRCFGEDEGFQGIILYSAFVFVLVGG